MKRTIIKLSLLLALLLPSGTTIAADAQKAADAKNFSRPYRMYAPWMRS